MPTNKDLLFNTFAASALKTIREFCHTPTEINDPFIKGAREETTASIAGIIGLTSSESKGTIGLSFPKPVFLHIMEKMFGTAATEITHENEDAAAELLNIICGQAKALLNRKGYNIQLAIPTLLRGEQINSSYAKIHEVKVIPFKTEAGEFYLEFLLNKVDEPKIDTKDLPNGFDPNAAAGKAAFFKPFLDGTLKTMSVQCGLECKPQKPYSRRTPTDYSFDIAGIIGITSKTVNGSFIISFSNEVFLKLISKMFGETITEFQPGLEDAVCELANIILGTAKAVLNAQGHGLQMAIPTVIYGEAIFSTFQLKRPAVVIPLQSPIGEFHVEVNFSEEVHHALEAAAKQAK